MTLQSGEALESERTMSNRQEYWAVNVLWQGPIFPKSLRDLQRFYGLDTEVTPINRAILEEVGRQIEGYCGPKESFVTADGYHWFCALLFKRSANTILIAFPWCQDWNKQHDTQTDRSIAIYYSRGYPTRMRDGEPGCAELLETVLAKLKARVGVPAAA